METKDFLKVRQKNTKKKKRDEKNSYKFEPETLLRLTAYSILRFSQLRILLKVCQNVSKRQKQEVRKFGNDKLKGFRMADNSMLWAPAL